MDIFPLEQRVKSNFYLQYLGFVEMPQRTTNPVFSSIGFPKKQDMILFVRDCETSYLCKDGKRISTKPGDVVYVPKGSEYRVECLSNAENGATQQMNFLLFDNDFQPFVFSDEILVHTPKTPTLQKLFEKVLLLDKKYAPHAAQKGVLLEILSTLAEEQSLKIIHPTIRNGMEILLAHYDDNPPISDLAKACHVSEEYFRKVFKTQTGKTPLEYKNELRLEKAEQYLLYSDLTVIEISEKVSFATVSHFIKRFKDKHGVSPLTYRNQFKRQ